MFSKKLPKKRVQKTFLFFEYVTKGDLKPAVVSFLTTIFDLFTSNKPEALDKGGIMALLILGYPDKKLQDLHNKVFARFVLQRGKSFPFLYLLFFFGSNKKQLPKNGFPWPLFLVAKKKVLFLRFTFRR